MEKCLRVSASGASGKRDRSLVCASSPCTPRTYPSGSVSPAGLQRLGLESVVQGDELADTGTASTADAANDGAQDILHRSTLPPRRSGDGVTDPARVARFGRDMGRHCLCHAPRTSRTDSDSAPTRRRCGCATSTPRPNATKRLRTVSVPCFGRIPPVPSRSPPSSRSLRVESRHNSEGPRRVF